LARLQRDPLRIIMSAAGLLVKQIEDGLCRGFLAFLRKGITERSRFSGNEGQASGRGLRTSAMEKQTKKVGGRAP
jgi:hypothetical protein